MKVFFDTNVYVAEALVGGAAEQIVSATVEARWKAFSSSYVLDETERVLTERLGFSTRFGRLTRAYPAPIHVGVSSIFSPHRPKRSSRQSRTSCRASIRR